MVPAGARISAGKFGSVARSLPNAAEISVNRSPTSCMPSPESPAKRMTTRSSVSARRIGLASRVTVDLSFLGLYAFRGPIRTRLPALRFVAPTRLIPNRPGYGSLYRHHPRNRVLAGGRRPASTSADTSAELRIEHLERRARTL